MDTIIDFTDEKEFYEKAFRVAFAGMLRMEFNQMKIEIHDAHLPFVFDKCFAVASQKLNDKITLIVQSTALQTAAELAKEIENERK